MLNELRNLDNVGGKEGILFLLCDVLGNHKLTLHDVVVLCSHRPGHNRMSVRDLVKYCHSMGWVLVEDNGILLNPGLSSYISDKDELNNRLISLTVNRLFDEEIFTPLHFWYDEVSSFYCFRDKAFPLMLCCVRDTLVSQGFFVTVRESNTIHYYIAQEYELLVAKHCKHKRKLMSLEQLKKEQEENEQAGELAELFALEYEKKRVGSLKADLIKRISEIDVSAGFDIVSFNSEKSDKPDRFIEVKAVSKDGFFWSRNEYETAKLRGEKYYIYLVDLQRTGNEEYSPEMISDPAIKIMQSEGWYVESESYHIRRTIID